MQPQASSIKPLHVDIVFPLLSTTCAHACCYFILHLHNLVVAQTDVLKTFLESLTSYWRASSVDCMWRRPFPLLVLAFVTIIRHSVM
jgi:hypothetical protein